MAARKLQHVQWLHTAMVLLLYVAECQGQITSGPTNEAALIGTQASLNCTTTGMTQSTILVWYMQPMSPSGTNGDVITVYNTASGFTSGLQSIFGIETSAGQYNLIVNSVALDNGAKYWCNILGSATNYYGELVAVGQLQCPTSGTTISPGEQIVAACSVTYQGYMTPVLTWMDGSGHQLSSVYNATNVLATAVTNFTANSTHDGMLLNCSLAFTLSSYIYDTHAANNLPTYTAECSTYYYVTHGVSVMAIQPPPNSQGTIESPLVPGQSINCTSNGRPTPTYTWVNAQGNGPAVSGQELLITNAMGTMKQPVTYICIATNSANGGSFNVSTSVTFTVQDPSAAQVQSSSVEPWVIAVAVVVPLVVIIAAAVIGFVLFKRHKANKLPQKTAPPPSSSSAPLIPPVVMATTSSPANNFDNRATSPPPPTAAPRSTGPSPYAPGPGRSYEPGQTSPASGYADIGGSTNHLNVGSAPRQTGSAASTPPARHAPTVNMNPDPRGTPRYNNTPSGLTSQPPPRPPSVASSVASGTSSTSSRGESNSTRTASNQFLPMAASPGAGAISPPPFAGGPPSHVSSAGGSRPGSRPGSALGAGRPPMPLSMPPPPPPHRSVSSMSGSSANGSVHGSFV